MCRSNSAEPEQHRSLADLHFGLLKAPVEELFEDDQAQDHLHWCRVPTMSGRELIASRQIRSDLFKQFVVIKHDIESFEECIARRGRFGQIGLLLKER